MNRLAKHTFNLHIYNDQRFRENINSQTTAIIFVIETLRNLCAPPLGLSKKIALKIYYKNTATKVFKRLLHRKSKKICIQQPYVNPDIRNTLSGMKRDCYDQPRIQILFSWSQQYRNWVCTNVARRCVEFRYLPTQPTRCNYSMIFIYEHKVFFMY